MREFSTGATRDDDDSKIDYEGFLSPEVLARYGEYMTEHRKQADGKLRDSDNWQKGIPRDAYVKSLVRHVVDFWRLHRKIKRGTPTMKYPLGFDRSQIEKEVEDLACSVLFNTMGFLHEWLLGRDVGRVTPMPALLSFTAWLDGGDISKRSHSKACGASGVGCIYWPSYSRYLDSHGAK